MKNLTYFIDIVNLRFIYLHWGTELFLFWHYMRM